MGHAMRSQLASSIEKEHWTTDDVRNAVSSARVVVFSKGSPSNPKCGFSKRTLSVVEGCGGPFEVVDVTENKSIRAALAVYAGERSLPLVFVDGELVPPSDYLDPVGDAKELTARVRGN